MLSGFENEGKELWPTDATGGLPRRPLARPKAKGDNQFRVQLVTHELGALRLRRLSAVIRSARPRNPGADASTMVQTPTPSPISSSPGLTPGAGLASIIAVGNRQISAARAGGPPAGRLRGGGDALSRGDLPAFERVGERREKRCRHSRRIRASLGV